MLTLGLIPTKNIMADLCCLLFTWSMMLLVLWLLEPLIQALAKFLSPHILVSYFQHTTHQSIDTRDLSLSSILARNHATKIGALSHKFVATYKKFLLTLAFLLALFSSYSSIHFQLRIFNCKILWKHRNACIFYRNACIFLVRPRN